MTSLVATNVCSDKSVTSRDLRIGRLPLNRILIESGVTIQIRIESRIELDNQ